MQPAPLMTEFPRQADVGTAYLLMRDYTKRHFPKIAYKRLLTTDGELDDIHGEVPETAKRWSPLIWARAFVVAEQITQPLTRFGLEEKRDAEIYLTVPDLVDAGLGTQDPKTYEVALVGSGIGDHFFYHGQEFEIRQLVPYARWGNTDIVLYYAATASLYRAPMASVG